MRQKLWEIQPGEKKTGFQMCIRDRLVSVPLGILSAVHKGGVIDYIVRGLTFLGVSLPNFWVGLLLLYVFGVKLSVVPVVSVSYTHL